MSITPGARFGAFEIAESIGAGGMGEVWRATDLNLKRAVAIKVLPEAFVADADRLARFRREAEILAALNHPNIAQVYGLEQAEGQTAIVMELVEGPTLAERIKDGPIAPEEALAIALQVIAALEAAHARGIVHRDLKPANVKVRDDGTVKVLDFGISKPIDPTAISGSAPVMTTPAVTQTGMILGTAAYMSPEQARGKFVDERTDVWAFGCLLFEMLTGQPVFGGDDVMLTLARVLDRDADLKSIPQTISPAVRHTIKLCLEKDPNQRIADIRDARLALAGGFESPFAQPVEDGVVLSKPLWRRAKAPAAALLGGFALALLAGWLVRPTPAPKLVDRFAIPVEQQLRYVEFGPTIALSSDGRRLAYNTIDGIYLRELSELAPRLIPGTTEDLGAPYFSPDAETIAFTTPDGPKRISISGGTSVPISGTEARQQVSHSGWQPDDTLLIGHQGGISKISVFGNSSGLILELGDNEQAGWPQLLPDGESVLFSLLADGGGWDDAQIVVAQIATGERHPLIDGGNNARYLPSGHIIFVRDATLFGVAFDLKTLSIAGGAEPLLEDLVIAAATGAANLVIADDGTLAYLVGGEGGANFLNVMPVWVARAGGESSLNINAQNGPHLNPRLNADGTRLAITIVNTEGGVGAQDVWTYNLTRGGSPTRLTRTAGASRHPVWTPANDQIVYWTSPPGVARRRADGTGGEELLWSRPDDFRGAAVQGISPDGNEILLRMVTTEDPDNDNLYRLVLGDEAELVPLLDADYNETMPALSPDGRWLAYTSDESGRDQVFVVPYPDVDSGKHLISLDGGNEPLWSRDGTELYYRNGETLMAVAVDTENGFETSIPMPLFSGTYLEGNGSHPNYDVHPDGDRFLMLRQGSSPGEPAGQSSIVVVRNWLEELKQRIPTGE